MMDYDESDLPRELILRAQAGEEAAFNTILRACKSRLLGMASRYVQSPAELDDLAQDIFVHIWKGLRTYRFDAPFPHWASRVAVNACLTHLKRRRRRQQVFISPDEPASLERVADVSAGDQDGAREAADRLLPAMQALRADERLIITLLHLEEKSVVEISALTGWTESNVKVRAMRARIKLKKLLTQYENTRG